jgi:glycosyltransferase involved in cell wall biosynthesis
MGGMEYYVQHISQGLVARGHEVTVFTSSPSQQQIIQKNHMTIYRLKINAKAYNVPIVSSLFWKLLEIEKPDIVHTHQYPVYFSDMATLYAKLRHIPLLLHVHVVSEAKSPLSGCISDLYYSSLGLCTLLASDCVIAPTKAYKTKLTEMHVSANKIQVLPYGIDLRKFQNIDGAIFREKYGCTCSTLLLSVGRLNYQKGFQYLIYALPEIIKEIPDVKLVIVGEGEQLPYLKFLAQKLGVDKFVIFTGAIPQVEIPIAYAACDLFVLPSLFESFGISLIEAQAAGKPVVSTRTGGTPEALLDGKTGLLVDVANPKHLGLAIIHILADRNLAVSMGREGHNFVKERYNVVQSISKMISLYEIYR